MGKRRTKAELDPGLLSVLIAVLKVGAGQEAACREAGISSETLRSYVLRGEAGEEPFAAWLPEFRRAQGGSRLYCLKLIHEAAEGNWRAASWLLEKLYPHEFGSLVQVKVEESRPAFDLSVLTVQELRDLGRIQAKLGAA